MKKSKRSRARHLALQALYQWYFTAAPTEDIDAQFREEHAEKASKIDVEYFSKLISGVINNVQALDEHIKPVLDRSINSLNPVELAVIRIACYELVYCPDVPYRVVINEALEAAKIFGATDGFKYVNGVLDKIARVLRADEMNS